VRSRAKDLMKSHLKARIFFCVGVIASTGLLLVPSAQADDQHHEYIGRREFRGHRFDQRSRPYFFGFTPSEYYHEHPIVMSDGPYFHDRDYMGPTVGFTFGFGGHAHQQLDRHKP